MRREANAEYRKRESMGIPAQIKDKANELPMIVAR